METQLKSKGFWSLEWFPRGIVDWGEKSAIVCSGLRLNCDCGKKKDILKQFGLLSRFSSIQLGKLLSRTSALPSRICIISCPYNFISFHQILADNWGYFGLLMDSPLSKGNLLTTLFPNFARGDYYHYNTKIPLFYPRLLFSHENSAVYRLHSSPITHDLNIC